MTWIIIAVLIVVFIAGYRILTSDTRKAVDSLAQWLRVKPMLIESMMQEMGGRNSQAFIRMLNNGYTEEMHRAAYLLFIYVAFIKEADDTQLAQWRDMLIRAGLSPELNAEYTESALFYFAELDLDAFELAQFRRAYNARFNLDAVANG
ncbi:DUF1198 family protein [Serratia rhizosphaerae]|uniref:DUF1198 family protein n=1 Tax=unclassified Serratia (in: enterobacteria) TaxID=2647522 RepID=UPI000CF70DD0|nr:MULTISPECIES: DUF1198 family protein [unclassified Serratia (in: enterobacteria)]MBU3891702.1 DUF1198 domain-containing protein [Serratia rubidaea]AVJ18921.1 hypothetical protein CLM71_18180 [Serratia sp. MYb239]MCA4825321.1 DUF1198 family protein [Serratia rubidaea]QNK33573.1 DUF1198 family protein [Serratia sp. JUb9]QPT12479.1 DUF1198 family protein [Serratia rubidaea]